MGKHSSAELIPAAALDTRQAVTVQTLPRAAGRLIARAGTGSPVHRTTPPSPGSRAPAPQSPATTHYVIWFPFSQRKRGMELLAVVISLCSMRDADESL